MSGIDDYKLRFEGEVRLVRLAESTRDFPLLDTLLGTAQSLFAAPGCTLGYL
jgi:hypothetical protein